jgi:hypothetical protein
MEQAAWVLAFLNGSVRINIKNIGDFSYSILGSLDCQWDILYPCGLLLRVQSVSCAGRGFILLWRNICANYNEQPE